jgi:hypothetical protein
MSRTFSLPIFVADAPAICIRIFFYMSIPNEALPNVSHNRQFPADTFTVPVSTSSSGLRSISNAGGELPPVLYRRKGPAGVQDWRNPKND